MFGSNGFHVNGDGVVSKCRALVRACPYQVHFATAGEGEAYVSLWEANRLRFPVLVDEPILEPVNGLVCDLGAFRDKGFLSGLPSGDGFACVVCDGWEDRVCETVRDWVCSGRVSLRFLGRASQLAGGVFDLTVDRLAGRVPSRLVARVEDYPRFWGELSGLVDVLRRDRGMVGMLRGFGFKVTDRVVDEGAVLRVFYCEPDFEYRFEEVYGEVSC